MVKGGVPALIVIALLTACHRDSGQSFSPRLLPPASVPVQAQRGPTPEELTAGMVEAVTIGKSSVPVAVKFELRARPILGQPLEVVLAVMPRVSANSATLEITPSEGLKLASGAAPVEVSPVEPAQVYRRSIALVPTVEGVQVLGIRISLKEDDVTESRAFSLPVIVATGADGAPAGAR